VPCDINSVIRSTVDLIRQEATDRNIEVVVLTDDHAPPIPCDLSQMKQALLNLLINAMDASVAGDTITVTTESSPAGVTLSVRDTAGVFRQRTLNRNLQAVLYYEDPRLGARGSRSSNGS